MLWGGAFLFLLGYAWVAHILVRSSVSRSILAGAEHFDLSLPGSCYAESEARARVRAVLPPVILPIFHVTFHAPLAWKTRRCPVRGSLSAGVNDYSVPFVPAQRGIYTAEGVLVSVRDILGFTASSLRVAVKNSLTVLPGSLLPPELPRRSGGGGDSSAVRETLTRSDELLDTRKYYPGDDVRRVNWKMFAHLRDLYIRIGEEIPPPNSRILVALDTSVPRLFRPEDLDAALDRAASHACGAALRFLDEGREVWLSFSGAPEALRITGRGREAVFAFFAGAWWSGEAIPLPENGPSAACLFSFPSSPGRDALLRPVRGRVFLLLPSPEGADTGKGPPLPERLLCRSRRAPSGGQPAGYGRAFREDFRELSTRGGEVHLASY